MDGDEVTEIECPECGHFGPHNPVDDSAVECARCYVSIDITGGSDE